MMLRLLLQLAPINIVVGANNETSKAVKDKKLLYYHQKSRRRRHIGNSDVASTVYVSTSEGTAYSDDYAFGPVPVELKTETTKVVTVKTKTDTVNDDNNIFGLMFLKPRQTLKIIIMLLTIRAIFLMILDLLLLEQPIHSVMDPHETSKAVKEGLLLLL